MKFKSLIFQEFRISRKGIVLQAALLLMWVALTWGMLLSAGSNELTEDALDTMINVIIIMTALIGAMSLLMDENFKSNVNSGWLNYSYTLPIKPLERTAAMFVRRFSVVFGSALLSLFNTAALCAYRNETFGANYIVWHIIVIAAVILHSLPNDIFMLRARSGEDMKKMQTVSGVIMTALMAIMIIVIFKASGIDLEKLTDSETFIKLPVLTAGALAWAVPLLLVMMAASFFASYYSLRSAYPNAVRPEKKNAEVNFQAELTEKTDGARGLLYKELKQNSVLLIFAALTPILLTAFPFCFSAIGAMTGSTGVDEIFETATNVFIRVLMCTIGIFVVSGLMSEVFRGDDKKLWAYFIVSTPQGAKGFLYRKYVMTLMMNLIYMVSGIFADNLLQTLNYFATGRELTTSMLSFYTAGVFLQMFISALDIPFTVRYGSKKGSMVKMIVMLSLCTVGTVVFSLLTDDARTKFTEIVFSVFNGDANETLLFIVSLLPYIALAAFLYSYKIACGVFMKGVNEYDK